MPSYLVLYRSELTAVEQMSRSTPEQARAGMEAWETWARRAGDAIVDLGAPLQTVDAGGDRGNPVGGYSILRADSAEAVATLLVEHPHAIWGGTIEILEMLPAPGS